MSLALIERSLRGIAGIVHTAPDYFGRNLRVEFDAAQTDTQSILSAIQSAGFSAQVKLPLLSATRCSV